MMDISETLRELISIIDLIPIYEFPSSTENIIRARLLARNAYMAFQDVMTFSNTQLRETQQKLIILEQYVSSLLFSSRRQDYHIKMLYDEINILIQSSSWMKDKLRKVENESVEMKNKIEMLENESVEMKTKIESLEKDGIEIGKEREKDRTEMGKERVEMKTKIEELETIIARAESERVDRERRGIIRTIALNIEFEIKEAAILAMSSEDRAYFCKGEVRENDVTRAIITDVMGKLDIQGQITVLSGLFGDEVSLYHYYRFLDASSYMKEGFLEDAHSTILDGGNVVLLQALHMVANTKMEGWRRRRPPSQYSEHELRETITLLLHRLDDLRQ